MLKSLHLLKLFFLLKNAQHLICCKLVKLHLVIVVVQKQLFFIRVYLVQQVIAVVQLNPLFCFMDYNLFVCDWRFNFKILSIFAGGRCYSQLLQVILGTISKLLRELNRKILMLHHFHRVLQRFVALIRGRRDYLHTLLAPLAV